MAVSLIIFYEVINENATKMGKLYFVLPVLKKKALNGKLLPNR